MQLHSDGRGIQIVADHQHLFVISFLHDGRFIGWEERERERAGRDGRRRVIQTIKGKQKGPFRSLERGHRRCLVINSGSYIRGGWVLKGEAWRAPIRQPVDGPTGRYSRYDAYCLAIRRGNQRNSCDDLATCVHNLRRSRNSLWKRPKNIRHSS